MLEREFIGDFDPEIKTIVISECEDIGDIESVKYELTFSLDKHGEYKELLDFSYEKELYTKTEQVLIEEFIKKISI